jgi:hypothetical protein
MGIPRPIFPSPFAHLCTVEAVIDEAALLVFDDPNRIWLLAQAAQRISHLRQLAEHNVCYRKESMLAYLWPEPRFMVWASTLVTGGTTNILSGRPIERCFLMRNLNLLAHRCLPSLSSTRH